MCSITVSSFLPIGQETVSRFFIMKAMVFGCSSRDLNMENSRFRNHKILLQRLLLHVNSIDFWKVLSLMKKSKKNKQRGIDILSLPVTKEVHNLEDKNCPECGTSLRKIGENKRNEFIYHPARYEVIEHIQYVYTCDQCDKETVKTPIYKEPMKEPVIYKSFASLSLLSYIIDNKFNKLLPLYRQEVMFSQIGLKLSRQTMANWMVKLYSEYFKIITCHMHKLLLNG